MDFSSRLYKLQVYFPDLSLVSIFKTAKALKKKKYNGKRNWSESYEIHFASNL